ncbi:MAG: META domain-containing protein [Phycisphaerales bacterium]
MKRMRSRLVVAGAALVMGSFMGTLPACQGGGGLGGAGSGAGMVDAVQKLAGEWVLAKMEGAEVASMLPAGWRVPSLNFGTDGKVSGYSGVNRLAGGFDVAKAAEGKLGLGNLASTRMAGPPEAMKVESMFTGLLGKVDGFTFTDSGKGLSLTEQGKTLLEFVKGGA